MAAGVGSGETAAAIITRGLAEICGWNALGARVPPRRMAGVGDWLRRARAALAQSCVRRTPRWVDDQSLWSRGRPCRRRGHVGHPCWRSHRLRCEMPLTDAVNRVCHKGCRSTSRGALLGRSTKSSSDGRSVGDSTRTVKALRRNGFRVSRCPPPVPASAYHLSSDESCPWTPTVAAATPAAAVDRRWPNWRVPHRH